MECKDDIKQPTLPTNTTEVLVRVRMYMYITVSAVFHITSIALVFHPENPTLNLCLGWVICTVCIGLPVCNVLL